VVGGDRVDLASALPALADRYGIRAVRVDAGGTLNGQLLRAGLVDEVSVIVAPALADPHGSQPVRLFDGLTGSGTRRLVLVDVRQLRGDHVWLRYVLREP
jgi:2,5-diamino-6-(ribosylamino)-4(3H)-pyrimidinone 5'-phosphate reductase